MIAARLQVRAEDAVLANIQLSHASGVGRAVDFELRQPSIRLVPAGHQQPGIIEAMIVMEVAEEDMRDIDRVDASFHHPVICSGTLVEQEGVATDLDHIAGAHAFERRCRGASA